MEEFAKSLVDLTFFVFDKTDNLLVMIPFAVLLICLIFALLRRFMRLF